MEWKRATIFAVFSFFCLVGIHAKIVYINGTEVFNEKVATPNVTTKPPVRSWYSVFIPRNISNHSGHLTSVHRKEDAEEKEVRKDVEKFQDTDQEEFHNDTLATRSARAIGLFYVQRIMTALHLLALLAGIYLMIFVVEPVAIPNRYLAQHYFGVPWLPERRTNPVQLNQALEVIAATLQYPTEPTVLQRQDSEVSKNKSHNNYSPYNINKPLASYPFLLSNYSEKPLSLQAAYSKSHVRTTKLNRTTAHHWHHWSPKTVIREKPKDIVSNGTVRWSSLISKNGQNIRSEAKPKTTGSVKSVDISEFVQ